LFPNFVSSKATEQKQTKMNDYFGKIELRRIENTEPNATAIGLLHAQFVHYPDCQQLIMWLPEYGKQDYGHLRLIDLTRQTIIEDCLVSERVGGSVQILWNTLELAPSDYKLEIDHPKGGQHVLYFTKYEVGKEPVVKVPEPNFYKDPMSEAELNGTLFPVYRDGFGKEIPNEDQILREKLQRDLINKFSRRLEYEGSYRDGIITYIEGDLRLTFYHEMYGGKYHMGINIPTEARWEAITKTPLSRRDDILDFLAKTVQREQASTWKYEIRETDIAYYS
jgi:hypothetical protein